MFEKVDFGLGEGEDAGVVVFGGRRVLLLDLGRKKVIGRTRLLTFHTKMVNSGRWTPRAIRVAHVLKIIIGVQLHIRQLYLFDLCLIDTLLGMLRNVGNFPVVNGVRRCG